MRLQTRGGPQMAEYTSSNSRLALRDIYSGYNQEVNMSQGTLLGSVHETSNSVKL